MMCDPEQTIGNLIDKQGVSFIGSVDGDGFQNTKACARRASLRASASFGLPHKHILYSGGAHERTL